MARQSLPVVLPETDLSEGTEEMPGLSPTVWGSIVIALVAALVLWLVL